MMKKRMAHNVDTGIRLIAFGQVMNTNPGPGINIVYYKEVNINVINWNWNKNKQHSNIVKQYTCNY